MAIIESLKGNFVTIDLGSSLSKNNKFLEKFFPAITAIEIDALDTGDTTASLFYRSIKLNSGVAGQKGTHTFYQRQHFECSSLLKVLPDTGKKYGISHLFETVNELQLECRTLPEILEENQINSISFLKTDLEGLDFAIIKSLETYLPSTLVIQSELRFDPFYETEPHSFEVQRYLYEHGFETITMLPTYYKYNTPNRNQFRDGRLVWGDFIFFKKLQADQPDFENNILKQILIAKSLKLNSHAEYLYELHRHVFSKTIQTELSRVLKPGNNIMYSLNKLFTLISYIDKPQIIRKGIKYLHKRASVIPNNCLTPPPN